MRINGSTKTNFLPLKSVSDFNWLVSVTVRTWQRSMIIVLSFHFTDFRQQTGLNPESFSSKLNFSSISRNFQTIVLQILATTHETFSTVTVCVPQVLWGTDNFVQYIFIAFDFRYSLLYTVSAIKLIRHSLLLTSFLLLFFLFFWNRRRRNPQVV